MNSKGKFISILIITLLTLLGVIGLVILNLDKLREWHDVEEEPPIVDVEVEDNTEEDIEDPVGEKFNMYLFWGDGCVHCHNLKIFLNDLEPKYKDMFDLYAFEVWGNPDNQTLMGRFAKTMGDSPRGVPYLVVGDKSFNGFSEKMEEDIIQAIIDEFKSDVKHDVFKNLED